MTDPLQNDLLVSEHISNRVRTQKITPAQAIGDVLVAILEKMTPQEQLVVEKQLNDAVGKMDEKSRQDVFVWRSPYQPKTETVNMKLTYGDLSDTIAVEFTQIDKIVHITVPSWCAVNHDINNLNFIKIDRIPDNYLIKFSSVYRIPIFNGKELLHTNGICWVDCDGCITIGVASIDEIKLFRTLGRVGFCRFTIMYSL